MASKAGHDDHDEALADSKAKGSDAHAIPRSAAVAWRRSPASPSCYRPTTPRRTAMNGRTTGLL